MNECNFLHHYKWNGGNMYFQFNFLKSQNIYLNFNISQKYPSFLTFFWKVGLGLGCIWQQFCQSDPEYIYASLAMLSLYAQVPGVIFYICGQIILVYIAFKKYPSNLYINNLQFIYSRLLPSCGDRIYISSRHTNKYF